MPRKSKDTTTRKKSGDNSPSTGKKKTNRREKVANPALTPKYNLKTRTDLLDQDYLSKLNEEELKWLNNFNEEYVNSSLDRVNLKNNLHNTEELKRDCDRRSNARRRCILTRQKATGRLRSLEDVEKVELNPVDVMDMAIDLKLMGMVDENGRLKKKKPTS